MIPEELQATAAAKLAVERAFGGSACAFGVRGQNDGVIRIAYERRIIMANSAQEAVARSLWWRRAPARR